MKQHNLNNKVVALICWAVDQRGKDDVVVFAGRAHLAGKKLLVDLESVGGTIQFDPEWLHRLKVVPADLKETLLNADFSVSLSVGEIPPNETIEQFITTGLKWCGNEKE